jgi:CheY-like chemotaxis protein
LIDDLLDMSRIEAGKVSLDLQRIDPGVVVTAGIETVRPAAITKEIRLTTAFSSWSGVVIADKSRLQQVVWNLLSNAIKFTPKGGRIHVVTKRVNSHVEICVADTGQGIPTEFLGQVFDRFRQADSTTTRGHGGLGLGLSIVKHLVELHGGTVRGESDGVGQGATFTVSLPLQAAGPHDDGAAEEVRKAAANTSASEPELTGTRVLLVDDEPDSTAIVRHALERRGAEVCVARSMDQALEEFSRFAPQVVLSDIDMPEHDGYELIRHIPELPDGRSVPAVALTALARAEDRTRALRAGFQLHVAKPVDFTELVAVVHNLSSLQKTGYMSPPKPEHSRKR